MVCFWSNESWDRLYGHVLVVIGRWYLMSTIDNAIIKRNKKQTAVVNIRKYNRIFEKK